MSAATVLVWDNFEKKRCAVVFKELALTGSALRMHFWQGLKALAEARPEYFHQDFMAEASGSFMNDMLLYLKNWKKDHWEQYHKGSMKERANVDAFLEDSVVKAQDMIETNSLYRTHWALRDHQQLAFAEAINTPVEDVLHIHWDFEDSCLTYVR